MGNRSILGLLRAALAVAILCLAGAGRAEDGGGRCGTSSFDPKDFTVYAFSQSGTNEEDPQVYRLKPDVTLRAFQKWSIWGDDAADYDFGIVDRYHEKGIAFIGGGTASVIFRQDFASDEIFDAMSTRDANGLPVPHDYIVPGARRGSLFNPAYRKYVVDWCKLQIDGGVDGLFLDEVIAGFGGGLSHNWNGNEGFDDFALADFNRYLMEKYPSFTAEDWKSAFGMTDDNLVRPDLAPGDPRNFDYRKYLQAHGWAGSTSYFDGPLVYLNPLASEWGTVTTNRMYAGDTSFTGTYLRRYWKEMVDELRAYAWKAKGRRILITSNGVFPYVDLNSVGMYPYNPDEQTADYRGADYVPVVDGHLNGAKSLLGNYRYLGDLGRQVSGDVPLVVFIDWPTDMMTNYLNLPLTERQDYWRIFGAEAYAAGLFPAFHLKDTVGSPTATDLGMMGFFEEYTRFFKQHRRLYRDVAPAPGAVRVGASNVAASLMAQRGGRVQVLHLVNHNYAQEIRPVGGFSVEVDLPAPPRRVTMVSPDFASTKNLAHVYRDGKLVVKVDGLRYYDVIVIE
jgi:hypothetical protein